MKLSLVIPVKNLNDPKLKDLLRSIEEQDFPKEEIETLLITEGTSESAKAIGIRRAKGEVIGILASDNFLTFTTFLKEAIKEFPVVDCAYPMRYDYKKDDDILNRYFALIGGNDVLCYYMDKNDRFSYLSKIGEMENYSTFDSNRHTSIGDNGFFVKKSLIEASDLDNYYHIDNAWEAVEGGKHNLLKFGIFHRTGGNIFKFFAKRYRYGLQHAFNKNRRWHLVDFKQPKDVMRLIWFITASVLIIPTLFLSIRGYLKIRDVAWFLHPIVCLMTVFTYGVLLVHLCGRTLFQLLSVPMSAQKA